MGCDYIFLLQGIRSWLPEEIKLFCYIYLLSFLYFICIRETWDGISNYSLSGLTFSMDFSLSKLCWKTWQAIRKICVISATDCMQSLLPFICWGLWCSVHAHSVKLQLFCQNKEEWIILGEASLWGTGAAVTWQSGMGSIQPKLIPRVVEILIDTRIVGFLLTWLKFKAIQALYAFSRQGLLHLW